MIFSEIYGRYFKTVQAILTEAAKAPLTDGQIARLVQKHAFGESMLTIPHALKTDWPLLDEEGRTVLRHAPTTPLTTLEKRWMKTLLDDPRVRLFAPPADWLADEKPLFPLEALVWYDRYADGDPYTDPGYISRFSTVLTALRENRRLKVRFVSGHGGECRWNCVPLRLEYSAKDDKFRLIVLHDERQSTVNLARLKECAAGEYADPVVPPAPRKRTAVVELTDDRNALERAMLQFSYLEKQTERLEDGRYRISLRYEAEDETELLINLLSFGPVLRVTAPERLARDLRQRVERQQALFAPQMPNK